MRSNPGFWAWDRDLPNPEPVVQNLRCLRPICGPGTAGGLNRCGHERSTLGIAPWARGQPPTHRYAISACATCFLPDRTFAGSRRYPWPDPAGLLGSKATNRPIGSCYPAYPTLRRSCPAFLGCQWYSAAHSGLQHNRHSKPWIEPGLDSARPEIPRKGPSPIG